MKRRACIALALLLAACQRSPAPPPTALVKIQNLPPRPKDVLDALLASSQVPLSADSSCEGAGTEPQDKTIGRYLSGFLAELSDPKDGNAIETSIESGQSAAGAEVWVCRVMLRHARGEEVWRWGVQFHVEKKDGAVPPSSFRCLGAG